MKQGLSLQMKAVIDIGSNSVRLLLSGTKYLRTTALAKGLAKSGTLSSQSIKDTLKAVIEMYDMACEGGAKHIYVFATEAVRVAQNSHQLINGLKDFDIAVDILTPEQETKIGFWGAYTKETQAILDIGGASSELSCGDKKGLLYWHSLAVGAQRLADYFTGNIRELSFYIKERIAEYGTLPDFDSLVAIGGTATTLVAIKEALEPYDAFVVQDYLLKAKEVERIAKEIFAMPLQARYNIKGLPTSRATVIAPGGLLLYHIMEYLGVESCIVSEKDNMEGYLLLKAQGKI